MLEGLLPNDAAHVMRLRCSEATARRVADIIVETFDPAETAAAAFEIEEGSSKTWSSGEWSVEVFFGRQPDEAQIRSLVGMVTDADTAAALEFSSVSPRDWIAASLEGLDAVREGRFVLHGAHARQKVQPGDFGIEIEAALAFGTGHHGTTRGCLVALNAVGRRRRPHRILDVGTGTGVLAIAAAKRFRRAVAAGDIDAIAVATARENARRNGVAGLVRPVHAVGLGHPDLRRRGPYDLILCNILARPLRALAPHIWRVVAPGGDIILSGLLAGDVPGVVSAYRTQGLVLTQRTNIEGWATLQMRRPVSSS